MDSSEVPEAFRAWQYSTRNKPFESNLQLNTIPQLPVPSKGSSSKQCVLVKVHAISINPADHKVPTTPVIGYLIVSRPATPCFDFAGTIAQLPDGGIAGDLKVGDRVWGRLDWPYQHGALAEYVMALPNGLVKLPGNLSMSQGAALGTAAISALQPLEPWIKPGCRVFINGSSGGVGSYSVQMAKLLGAGHVTATCSSANADRVKRLGADEVIDYRSTSVVDALKAGAKDTGKQFDVMIENVGQWNNLYEESHHYLHPNGVFVHVAAPDKKLTDMSLLFRRMLWPGFLGGGKRRYRLYSATNVPRQLQMISDWVAQGKLEISIDSEYGFEQAKEAFEHLRSDRAKGKVVVKVCDE